ncbi:YgiQ family radical SAM protein [Termitidicoccus mucosus]|uniref:YgiQ family radical SAM protein n=1 Tax=Termitidicoccus mucosus TaxID=1184151 RepID=UPI002FEE1895
MPAHADPRAFLPTSKKELDARGWDCADIILFTGDAYVDHPSFGAAVIGRVLEARGWRVAIVPQPNWRDDLRDFRKLGAPRLFFGVSAGCMDSMVNHYTANRRLRSDDAYTVDARAGARPDYAATVYTQILKRLYPETPVVLGGIEASLRRLTHYDYWSDTLKPGVLVESGADLLVYGLGEKPVCEIAARLAAGEAAGALADIRQTAFLAPRAAAPSSAVLLHSYEDCLADKHKFAANFRRIEEESNRAAAATLVEPVGDRAIVVNPPHPCLTPAETDASFDLPYTRVPHPRYKGRRIPAYEMIRHSITMHRGCFGGCSFCTISAHQGKFISSRTEASILREVDRVAAMPDFKGNISDLGGPSANMYGLRGRDETICARCRRPSCLHPRVCRNLDTDLTRLTALYRKVLAHPEVKRAFVGSGIRYDIFLDDKTGDFRSPDGRTYFEQLVRHHVSGRLKVAPEHSAPHILAHIRKPGFAMFEAFKAAFDDINEKEDLRQQLVPYFISSLPYCREEDMRALSTDLKRLGYKLEQVQDFTPTPMTLDSAIYHSGIDPYTGREVYVARDPGEKLRQRGYFFEYKQQHRPRAKRPRPPQGENPG